MKQTFTARLTGNRSKLEKLDAVYADMQRMSKFMFDEFDWSDKSNNKFSKKIYARLRAEFPSIHSKLVQKAMKEYGKFGKAKKAKKPIDLPLIFDSQNFDFELRTGYYNLFIKFLKIRFPIEGKRTIDKIRDLVIKQITVKNIKNEYRIYLVCETNVPPVKTGGAIIGVDLNVDAQVCSDGKFFHCKTFSHRKDEYRKGKGKKNIENFTRDHVHKLTNRIVRHADLRGAKVLRLEDLRNIRKRSRSKKHDPKERAKNHKVNNSFPFHMIRTLLEYKCALAGIDVEYINPAYTSQTCSKCGSLDTSREPRNTLTCLTCFNVIHADLNGARNIARCKPRAMGQRLTRPSSAVKSDHTIEIDGAIAHV